VIFTKRDKTPSHPHNWRERLKACLTGRAIGDALGIPYEDQNFTTDIRFDHAWLFSDDTQLTLATCEAIMKSHTIEPEMIAKNMLSWYNSGKLSGLGSSTLKALRELQVGGHWALTGRQGEYAAGNGAAMRIAPLAFKQNTNRFAIKDVTAITHKNDEAYAGALALYTAIVICLKNEWQDKTNLLQMVAEQLPDTAVRDQILQLNRQSERSIAEIAIPFPPTGHVVKSVPFVLFATSKVKHIGFKEVIRQIIAAGGDTDTNCSMAGQVMGAYGGMELIPSEWKYRFSSFRTARLVEEIVDKWVY